MTEYRRRKTGRRRRSEAWSQYRRCVCVCGKSVCVHMCMRVCVSVFLAPSLLVVIAHCSCSSLVAFHLLLFMLHALFTRHAYTNTPTKRATRHSEAVTNPHYHSLCLVFCSSALLTSHIRHCSRIRVPLQFSKLPRSVAIFTRISLFLYPSLSYTRSTLFTSSFPYFLHSFFFSFPFPCFHCNCSYSHFHLLYTHLRIFSGYQSSYSTSFPIRSFCLFGPFFLTFHSAVHFVFVLCKHPWRLFPV